MALSKDRTEVVRKWYAHYTKHIQELGLSGYVSRQFYYDRIAEETGLTWETVKRTILQMTKRGRPKKC